MSTLNTLPKPSRKHATCAWCAATFGTVVELIDHVDGHHLADTAAIEPLRPWAPTPAEVQAIVEEMRPIIDAFAQRDRQRLESMTGAVPV